MADGVAESKDAAPLVLVVCGNEPDNRYFSGSDNFTGGVRFGCCRLGDRGGTGSRTEGVAKPMLAMPFAVVGCGGECFVGEIPVVAGGRAEARLGSERR
jgi:hypothetical protein